MTDFFSRVYSSWDDIQKEKYEALNKILKIFEGKKLLDIGSPDDRFLEFLKANRIEADVVAIDIEGKPDVLGDGNHIPFPDNSFDAVVSIDAMHFIKTNDFERILGESGIALFGIFFNNENFEEKRRMIIKKLKNFNIIDEFEIHGKENEYFVLAMKK